jgi:hypothetical protein
VSSPLEKGDPEIDTSEPLDEKGIQQYQSLVGAQQEWAVSIGRIDITNAVMTLSGFRCAPCQGHLDLVKMKHAAIRVRPDEADYYRLPEQADYSGLQEAKVADVPGALGKYVTLVTYCIGVINGRSVSGILHLANKTSIDWYSKKQATVETATYGSEYVAARTYIEQQTPIEATVETATYGLEYAAARTCFDPIMDLRPTLQYIRSKRYVFGESKTVVESSIRPHVKLDKRHMTLSFHRVRKAIAAKTVGFTHVDGVRNPADILSKHWAYQRAWRLLRPLLKDYGHSDRPPDPGYTIEILDLEDVKLTGYGHSGRPPDPGDMIEMLDLEDVKIMD